MKEYGKNEAIKIQKGSIDSLHGSTRSFKVRKDDLTRDERGDEKEGVLGGIGPTLDILKTNKNKKYLFNRALIAVYFRLYR